MSAVEVSVGKTGVFGGICLVLLQALFLPATAVSQTCGDINGDGVINIFDIVSVARYLHDDGCIISGMQQVPCHESEADVDGHCGLSIGDALLLAEYVFVAGPLPSDCSTCSASPLPTSEFDTIRISSAVIPANTTTFDITVSGTHREFPFGNSTLALSIPLEIRGNNFPVIIDSIAGFSSGSPGMAHTADIEELTGNVRISIFDVSAQRVLTEFTLTIYGTVSASAYDQILEVDTVAAPPLDGPVIARGIVDYEAGFELFRPVFEGLVQFSCPDLDSDNVCDSVDNCPSVANPGQEDGNGNGIGDACEIVCGDADGSGQVDVTDVVHLINYIFAGGQPPQDIAAGDYNCDARTNITDAVYMINYIFAAGPPPCADC